MTDLETRLAEGLAGTGERAPHPADLAAGARERLRRRRRTTTAVVAAALAVVAVPVAVAVVVEGAGPGRDGSATSGTPGDWRTETWRDLSVSVPPDWAHQDRWCDDGGDVEAHGPGVSRPLTEAPLACFPAYGYGAHFSEPSGELPPGTEGTVQQYHGDQRYPDGAWIAYLGTRHAAVWIVTDDPVLTRQVLDSVEPAGEVDANGCATRAERLAASARERLSVCRYDADGWLAQSELLSGQDSVVAAAALEDAPAALLADPACAASYPARPWVTMSGAGASARLYVGRGCGVASVFSDGSGTGALVTEDVLYWALSPGWPGSAAGGAPLPEGLRTR